MAQSRGRFDSSSLFLRLGAPCAVAALACGVASAQNSAAWPAQWVPGDNPSTSSITYSNVDDISGVAIGCDAYATYVVRKDGRLAAWGPGLTQLDVPASFPAGIAELAVGYPHVLVRLADGTVFSWGDSQNAVPPGLGPVRRIAAGRAHSLAVKFDGTVVAWGFNSSGSTVPPAGLSEVQMVAAGQYFSMALKQDGTIVCFGVNSSQQCNVPVGLLAATHIDGGNDHSGAVLIDGTVATWGGGVGSSNTPPAGLVGVTTLACGSSSNIALRSNGSVVTWGSGVVAAPSGLPPVRAVSASLLQSRFVVLTELGSVVEWGSSAQAVRGAPIVAGAVKLRTGGGSASANSVIAAIDADGQVTAWGGLAFGQTSVPADLGAVDDVAIGGFHALALTRGGVVRGWGSNSSGQISVPANLGAVSAIAAGERHSLAVRSTSQVAGWGSTTVNHPAPPSDLSGVVQVTAGNGFSAALKTNGSVVCWGSNSSGQATVPANLGTATSIAAGSSHMLARRADGTVVGWGGVSVPANLGPVKSIAAGGIYSAAIKADGTVATWGNGIVAPTLPEPATFIGVNYTGFVARLCRTPEYERWSGDLGPVGFGTPRSFTFSSLPQAAGPVTVTVRARGSFLAATQYLDVTLEAETGSVARLFQSNATNCPVSPDVATFEISAAQFAARTSDGALTIVLRPSFTVQTGACIDGYSEIGLTYNTLPFDCNSNGIEDACEISDNPSLDCNDDGQIDSCQPLGPADDCDGDGQRDACQIVAGAPDDDFDGHLDSCEYARGDFDLDGTVGAPDLGILLALWGIPKPPAGDFNGDGAVGAPDLAIFLARWGPVVWP